MIEPQPSAIVWRDESVAPTMVKHDLTPGYFVAQCFPDEITSSLGTPMKPPRWILSLGDDGALLVAYDDSSSIETLSIPHGEMVGACARGGILSKSISFAITDGSVRRVNLVTGSLESARAAASRSCSLAAGRDAATGSPAETLNQDLVSTLCPKLGIERGQVVAAIRTGTAIDYRHPLYRMGSPLFWQVVVTRESLVCALVNPSWEVHHEVIPLDGVASAAVSKAGLSTPKITLVLPDGERAFELTKIPMMAAEWLCAFLAPRAQTVDGL